MGRSPIGTKGRTCSNSTTWNTYPLDTNKVGWMINRLHGPSFGVPLGNELKVSFGEDRILNMRAPTRGT